MELKTYETAPEWLPIDQREEWEPGCRTSDSAPLRDAEGNAKAAMWLLTVWPDGRAALWCGGESIWGEYDEQTGILTIDDTGDLFDTSEAVLPVDDGE